MVTDVQRSMEVKGDGCGTWRQGSECGTLLVSSTPTVSKLPTALRSRLSVYMCSPGTPAEHHNSSIEHSSSRTIVSNVESREAGRTCRGCAGRGHLRKKPSLLFRQQHMARVAGTMHWSAGSNFTKKPAEASRCWHSLAPFLYTVCLHGLIIVLDDF
jgi:hypothetical protein